MTAVSMAACSPAMNTPDAATRAAAIDTRLPQLRHDTATVLGLSAEGSTVDAAYDGAALRRLHAEHLGEMGRASETFFLDSAVFLIIRRDWRYDSPLSGRVVDSSDTRLDLTLPGTTPQTRDSVARAVRTILDAMKAP